MNGKARVGITLQKFAWFIGLWLAGVTGVGIVAFAIQLILAGM